MGCQQLLTHTPGLTNNNAFASRRETLPHSPLEGGAAARRTGRSQREREALAAEAAERERARKEAETARTEAAEVAAGTAALVKKLEADAAQVRCL